MKGNGGEGDRRTREKNTRGETTGIACGFGVWCEWEEKRRCDGRDLLLTSPRCVCVVRSAKNSMRVWEKKDCVDDEARRKKTGLYLCAERVCLCCASTARDLLHRRRKLRRTEKREHNVRVRLCFGGGRRKGGKKIKIFWSEDDRRSCVCVCVNTHYTPVAYLKITLWGEMTTETLSFRSKYMDTHVYILYMYTVLELEKKEI